MKPCCAAKAAVSPLRAALPAANQREVVAALWCPTPGAEKVSASAKALAASSSFSPKSRAATAATPNGAAK